MSIDPQHLAVTLAFDAENRVWFVHESDLPGLCAEAGTLDEISGIIADLAPDLAVNLPPERRGWALRVQHLLPGPIDRAA